jgi:hypothetical protein
MNAISVYRRNSGEQEVVGVYDINQCIRRWGRRGILSGGLLGLILGAIFVANPLVVDALAFGTIGTLIVCVMECAVVGGGFGALLAALNGEGVPRGSSAGLARSLATGRPNSYQSMLPATGDHGDIMDSLWHDSRTRTNTIHHWEDQDGAFEQEAVTASTMNGFVVFAMSSATDVNVDRPR